MSIPKTSSKSIPMTVLIVIYMIIYPILTLITSIISNPDLDSITIIVLSVILMIPMVIMGIVFAFVLNKEYKQNYELEQRKIAIEEKKIEGETQIKAHQAKLSPLDASNIFNQILSNPEILSIVVNYMKKEIEKKMVEKKEE